MGPLETRGKKILDDFCESFPAISLNRSNHVLPPYFISTLVETRDPATNKILPNPLRHLSEKEERQLQGIETRQTGEMAEHDIFKLIHDRSRKAETHQFLAINTLELDTSGMQHQYEDALQTELPSFPPGIPLNIELDVVVFVRNLGVIGMEVKSTNSTKSMTKAEQQLTNGQHLFGALMSSVSGHSPTATLPYVRVICIPNDPNSSPSDKTIDGSHLLNKDVISKPEVFHRLWNVFVQELVAQRSVSTFTDPEFEKFTKISVGLWSSKCTPKGLVFEHYKASITAGKLIHDSFRI